MKADNPYPFLLDDRTCHELGEDGMRDLARHLWAKDCQSCGWQLGQEPPTVVIDDLLAFITAGLHHARCKPAQWRDSGPLRIDAGRHLSYDVLSLRLTGPPPRVGGHQPDSSPTTDMPMILVNPGLECVSLTRVGDGWRVSTLDHWRRLGLTIPTGGALIGGRRPVPNIHLDFQDGELVVTAEKGLATWNVSYDADYETALQAQGGAVLAVTTAAIPSQLRTLMDLWALVSSGQVATGWLGLPGAVIEPPEPEHVPTAVATFVLHWGPGQATVGELLATADPSLPLPQAQAWADEQIRAFTLTARRWEQETADPGTWSRLDPLSAIFYFLRRHPDGWKLLQILARRGGDTLSDPAAREWATRAVRRRGATQILGWIPVPNRQPGFTTLHGTAPLPTRPNP